MLTQQNRNCKPRHSFLSSAVTTALLCSPPCLTCLREGSGVNKETGLSEKQTSSFTAQARALGALGAFLKVEDAQELVVFAAGACQKCLYDL